MKALNRIPLFLFLFICSSVSYAEILEASDSLFEPESASAFKNWQTKASEAQPNHDKDLNDPVHQGSFITGPNILGDSLKLQNLTISISNLEELNQRIQQLESTLKAMKIDNVTVRVKSLEELITEIASLKFIAKDLENSLSPLSHLNDSVQTFVKQITAANVMLASALAFGSGWLVWTGFDTMKTLLLKNWKSPCCRSRAPIIPQ